MATKPLSKKIAIEIQKIPEVLSDGQYNNPAIDKALNRIHGIRVDKLKLVDLITCACHCNGVYLFYDYEGALDYKSENAFNDASAIGNVVYVGKASSRSFVERIAAHFAPRNWDFMNTLIKRIAEIKFGHIDNYTICESFQIARKFYLKLIYFDSCNNAGNLGSIDDLEVELIGYYKPTLNKIPGCRNKNRR